MQLIRDKQSELYDKTKGIFEERLPKGYYEILLRGELSYPVTEYDSTWITSVYVKKDQDTDNFIKGLLNINIPRNVNELQEAYKEITKRIETFKKHYCNKYDLLEQEFNLFIQEEDKYNMEKETEYLPITKPFELFITYNDNGKHYRVTK